MSRTAPLARLGEDRERARPAPAASSRAAAETLERVAWLMDRAFGIPGTRFRVGLDAILGLVPGAGDLVAGLVQAGLVMVALTHYRVPKLVAARMAGNVLLDVAVGAIPILGDVFDAFFKANTRNLRLLEPYHAAADAAAGRAIERRDAPFAPPLALPAPRVRWGVVVTVGLVLLAALALLVVGLVTVVRWLF